MAMKHLSNELEGAKSAKTALEQAMYSREVLYVLRSFALLRLFVCLRFALFQSRFC